MLCVFSSTSGSDGGAYAVLTGAMPAPAVPAEFSRRFPLPSNPNLADSSSEREEGLVMRDLRGVAPRACVGGQWATFTGFEHREDDKACIDFVFGRSDGGWCVFSCSPILQSRKFYCHVLGRRRTCLSRRHFQMMVCSRVTIVLSLRILPYLE
jgi:hypothetical protein